MQLHLHCPKYKPECDSTKALYGLAQFKVIRSNIILDLITLAQFAGVIKYLHFLLPWCVRSGTNLYIWLCLGEIDAKNLYTQFLYSFKMSEIRNFITVALFVFSDDTYIHCTICVINTALKLLLINVFLFFLLSLIDFIILFWYYMHIILSLHLSNN